MPLEFIVRWTEIAVGFRSRLGVLIGLELGLVNGQGNERIRGSQLGGINAAEYCGGIQVGMGNSAEVLTGAQIGILNMILQAANYSAKNLGVQFGLFNFADELTGLQAGLFCFASDGNYLQAGLLNVHGKEGPWYTRFSPLLGFHRDRNAAETGAPYGLPQ